VFIHRDTDVFVDCAANMLRPGPVGHSYHALVEAAAGRREFRYDFDPPGHAEMPYHAHPERDISAREPWSAVEPTVAIDRLQQIAANELELGNL
jgi:hypothetical protein